MQATTYGETAKTGLLFSTSQILLILSCVLFVSEKIWFGAGFLSMAIIGIIIRFGLDQQERDARREQEKEISSQLNKIANLQPVTSQKDPVH